MYESSTLTANRAHLLWASKPPTIKQITADIDNIEEAGLESQ